jgi:CarboxypepD_reg-like domain/TonB-dependent Receptor Plug Domain
VINRPRGAFLIFAFAAPGVLNAQSAVRGRVLDAETKAPVEGAVVTARTATRAVTTDRLGRFTLWIQEFPETLTVVLIGRHPALVTLPSAPVDALEIELAPAAVTLSDVIVTAPAGAARPIQDVGRWQVPATTLRAAPAAIEPDVFRALAMVPAVSFSTPLSARPIIRGYDAGQSSVRIDGFEVFDLYHIGRIFSAFPADAASQVSVAAAPQSVATGGTTSGTVDISGQVGEPGEVHGGADFSLASLQGWAGGGGAGVRWFGAARAVHLAILNAVSGAHVPYDFEDAYANALFSAGGRSVGRITAFASRDHLLDRDLGSGMDWSNLLLGTRWQLVDDVRNALELWGSATRFAEDGADIPVRFSHVDIRNRFERLAVGADFERRSAVSTVALGFSAGWHSIGNRISQLTNEEFPAADTTFGRLEGGFYSSVTFTLGRASLQAGGRLDVAGGATVFQPRARVAVPLGTAASLGFAVGRTARLYHLVADPEPEPNLAFYDFWLNAGDAGVPVPIVDHGSIDLDLGRGALAGRVSLFGSSGHGLVEVRPPTDQRAEVADAFRFGRGRTAGLEAQVALRGNDVRGSALSVSYVLSYSDRNWGAGWVPWVLDRRHLFRIAGRARLGTHWSLSGAFEGSSGPPLTPVDGVIFVDLPDSTGPSHGGLAYLYGAENSARSAGTARVDVGATYSFKGPGRTRMALGLSVINLGFGPVAPLTPADPGLEPGNPPMSGPVRYQRLFDLPAVPSFTFRLEF